jgi:tape measure domain-containing protein
LRDAQTAAKKAEADMAGKGIELKAKVGFTVEGWEKHLKPFHKAIADANEGLLKGLPSVASAQKVFDKLAVSPNALKDAKAKLEAAKQRQFMATGASSNAGAPFTIGVSEKAFMAPFAKAVKDAQKEVDAMVRAEKRAESAAHSLALAINRQVEAKKQLTQAQAQFNAEANKWRGKVGAGRITEAEYKSHMAPYEAAVAAAKERVSIVGKTSKADIGMGGAVSALVNFGSAFLRVGAIAFTAGKAIFSVFSWVGGVLWSVAKGIFSAFQWAFEKIVAGAKWAFKMIAGAAAVTGTAIGYSMKQAANIETQRAAMGLLLKDVALGNKIIADIQNRTMQTPFSFDVLAQQARYMTAVGIAGKDIPKFLDAIADAAAGTGKGVIALQEISLALGQIQSKGRLQAEEMTRQLANAGVNAWKYLADASGKSVREIQEQMRKDVIEAKDALPLIIAGMQRQFGGAAARLAQSTEGVWARIAAGAKLIAVELGEPINRVITPWLNRLLSNFEMAKRYASDIGKRLADGLNVFANAWQAGTLVQTLWTQLKWVFAEAGNWLLAAFKAVGNSLAGIFRIEGLWPALGQTIGGAFKFGVGVFLEAFGGIIPQVTELLVRAAGYMLGAIKGGFLALGDLLMQVMQNAGKALIAANMVTRADIVGRMATGQSFTEAYQAAYDQKKKWLNIVSPDDYWTGQAKANVIKGMSDNVFGDEIPAAARKKAEGWVDPKNTAAIKDGAMAKMVAGGAILAEIGGQIGPIIARSFEANFPPADRFGTGAKADAARKLFAENALRDKTDAEKKADQTRLEAAAKRVIWLQGGTTSEKTMNRAFDDFKKADAEAAKSKTSRALPEPVVPPALKDVTAKARTEVKTDFAGAAGTFSAAALSSLGAYGGAADKVVGAIDAGNILLGDIKTNTANMGSTWQ